MKRLFAVGDNAVLEIIKEESVGSIILPDNLQINPVKGKIIHLGKKQDNLYKGDIVYFDHQMRSFAVGNNVIVRIEDIIAKEE